MSRQKKGRRIGPETKALRHRSTRNKKDPGSFLPGSHQIVGSILPVALSAQQDERGVLVPELVDGCRLTNTSAGCTDRTHTLLI